MAGCRYQSFCNLQALQLLASGFHRSMGCSPSLWVRRISCGTVVPGCSGGDRAELSMVLASPWGCSVGSQASLGKKVKEIISQISVTVFHNFCYLNLVSSCSLKLISRQILVTNSHLADDLLLKIITLELMIQSGGFV